MTFSAVCARHTNAKCDTPRQCLLRRALTMSKLVWFTGCLLLRVTKHTTHPEWDNIVSHHTELLAPHNVCRVVWCEKHREKQSRVSGSYLLAKCFKLSDSEFIHGLCGHISETKKHIINKICSWCFRSSAVLEGGRGRGEISKEQNKYDIRIGRTGITKVICIARYSKTNQPIKIKLSNIADHLQEVRFNSNICLLTGY